MKKIFSSGVVSLGVLAALFPCSSNAQQFSEENLKAIAAAKEAELKRARAQLDAVNAASAKRSAVRVPTPEEIGVFDGFVGGQPVYFDTNNLSAAKTISADDVWSGGTSGLSLSGSGQKIAIWDEGSVLSSHVEFGSRVTIKDAVASNPHATHVAGTMIASGVDANAKGMAPAATLNSYDFSGDVSEMATAALPPSSGGYNLALSNHSYAYNTGWYLDNSGNLWWGGDPGISTAEDWHFGYYDSKCRDYDDIVYNAPLYSVVVAAGNSRGLAPASQPIFHWEFWSASNVNVYTNIVRPANSSTYDCLPIGGPSAKNVITVGAVLDIPAGYSIPSDVQMTTFSSWGPTDDGRIKPDLVANGYDLYSTFNSGNSDYAIGSGTSMAAPTVTGSIALLKQHWNNLFVGSAPLAATIKAILINTADEAGANDGPDYAFGWGLVNTAKAAALISTDASAGADFNIRELGLASTDTVEFPINLNSANPMRATIAWTDPAASVPAVAVDSPTSMLKHDLDLRIVGASTFSPWVLNPASPASAATTGDNTRDNVERLDVASPTTGTYRATVSHKGTLTKPGQNFSFAISGATRPSDFWTTTISKNTLSHSASRGACQTFDSSGNRFFAAQITTTSPNRVRITKYDSEGSVVWTQTWSSGSTLPINDSPTSLKTDSSGNLYMAAVGNNDAYVVKYNPGGTKVWERSYDKSGNPDIPRDLAISSNGDAYVAIAAVQSSLYSCWVVIKYLSNGTTDWTKTFSPSGSAHDIPNAIAVDSTGACYITGAVGGAGIAGITGQACTVKYNSNGAKAWDRQNTIDDNSSGWDVAVDSADNAVVFTRALYGHNVSVIEEFQTIKYNSSGTAQWTNRMTTTGGYDSVYPRSLLIDASNNVFITGYWTNWTPVATPRVVTAKYTSGGTLSWSSNLTYAVSIPSTGLNQVHPCDTMKLDSSGNVLVAGTFHNGSNYDAGFIKLNSSGTFVSLRTYDCGTAGTHDYQWSGPDIGPDGNIYIQSAQVSASTGLTGIISTTAFKP